LIDLSSSPKGEGVKSEKRKVKNSQTKPEGIFNLQLFTFKPDGFSSPWGGWEGLGLFSLPHREGWGGSWAGVGLGLGWVSGLGLG